MEKFALTLQSTNDINNYLLENNLMRYEQEILAQILSVIDGGNADELAWYAGFGDSFRKILMNVNGHRRALEFGFTEIAFDKYGWLATPKFLEFEVIQVEQNEIRVGRGPNGLWAYAISSTFGTGGSSGPLGVFCKKYPTRAIALTAALIDMKQSLSSKIGHPDTLNYKQDLIIRTLKAIAAIEVGMVQLNLF